MNTQWKNQTMLSLIMKWIPSHLLQEPGCWECGTRRAAPAARKWGSPPPPPPVRTPFNLFSLLLVCLLVSTPGQELVPRYRGEYPAVALTGLISNFEARSHQLNGPGGGGGGGVTRQVTGYAPGRVKKKASKGYVFQPYAVVDVFLKRVYFFHSPSHFRGTR